MSIFKIDDSEELPQHAALRDYIKYFETMTPQTAAIGARHYAAEARYQTPLRDLQGREPVILFLTARRQALQNYVFKVRHVSWDENVAYLRWDLLAQFRGRKLSVSGMSEITFGMDHRILSHIDYYDPLRAFLYGWPLWGVLLRMLHKKTR